MSHEEQQQRAVRAADVLDRVTASLIELNGQAQAATEQDEKGRRTVLENLTRFVESVLPDLTDLSMQIRPARIVRPGEE